MKTDEFRRELDLATQGIPSRHPQAVKDLVLKYPHTISLRCNPNMMEFTSDCFLFAFEGRIPFETLNKIQNFSTEQSKSSDMFYQLISKNYIELHNDRESDDKIVIYFKNELVTHFGKLKDDKVISKWGGGLIWEHSIWEVPFSYGKSVKYSNGIVNNDILNELVFKN
jgi:hypothetical protein